MRKSFIQAKLAKLEKQNTERHTVKHYSKIKVYCIEDGGITSSIYFQEINELQYTPLSRYKTKLSRNKFMFEFVEKKININFLED